MREVKAMAAVRGIGFSSAVQEDIYFDRLRENPSR
jgi:hypothetical protein